MQKNINRPLIAERSFFIKGDESKKIHLKILGPSEDNPDFILEMDGVDPQKYPCMFGGTDSLQAFLQTALLLKEKLDDINTIFFGGNLRWHSNENTDLGVYNKF